MKKISFKMPAFSLAEALITLLIVCLVTLASIPILTKKKRNPTQQLEHGAFACYWDGDELVSKYIIKKEVMSGEIITDNKEVETRLEYDENGKPHTVTSSRKGCVFDPPKGAKNFVVTLVGGGGGGASGFAEASNAYFLQDDFGGTATAKTVDIKNDDKATAGNAGGGDEGNSIAPDDIDTQEKVVQPAGEGTYQFKAPGTAQYQFLIAGAGGGGGTAYGGCHEGHANAKEWPCGGTGSPGAVLVTEPQIFDKGTEFTIKVGNYGKYGLRDAIPGTDGGNSSVVITTPKYGNYLAFAQGGGGGFSPDYEGRNYCGSYENFPNLKELIGRMYNGVTISQNYYNRVFSYLVCSDNKVAIQMKSGAPGGYFYRGFKMQAENSENGYIPQWDDIERVGAYKMDYVWKKIPADSKDPDEARGMGIYAVKNGYNASRPFRNSLMTEELMRQFRISHLENQNYPFASGGAGDVSHGDGNNWPTQGGRGVVAVIYHMIYGGLGGNAGQVLQIPYSELPQKTRVFPGKGGHGGSFFVGRIGILYMIGFIPATSGLSSYIKNGAAALGGAPATTIVTTNDKTYYSLSDGTTVGQNGEMASVSPSVKTAGGAGAKTTSSQNYYMNNSNNIYGQTRKDIFKNEKLIGFFNEIVGAGAGGGGGSATDEFILPTVWDELTYDKDALMKYVNTNLGKGGDGSSGLVFIQW